MALPIGKVVFLVGTGVVVSSLAKEWTFGDYVSGAAKILFGRLKQESSKTPSPKPRSDALLQQVNSLREELQLLASNRSVTVVTSDVSGSSGKYGLIIVVLVVGCGCIWWKGWKLSDFMFATRRGLTDSCDSVTKQLQGVNSSVSDTKRFLSSRIDRVDSKVDEYADDTAVTKDEVSEIRGKAKSVDKNVLSIQNVVLNLENKINLMEGRENEMNGGVRMLVSTARANMKKIEASSSSSARPALELPGVNLPAVPLQLESSSPSSSAERPSPSTSNGFPKRPVHAVLRSNSGGAKILHRGVSFSADAILFKDSRNVKTSK